MKCWMLCGFLVVLVGSWGCGGGGTGGGGGSGGLGILQFRVFNLGGTQIMSFTRPRYLTHQQNAEWINTQVEANRILLPGAYLGNVFSQASGHSFEYPGPRGTVLIDGQIVQEVQPFVDVTKGLMDQVISESVSGDLTMQLQAYPYP